MRKMKKLASLLLSGSFLLAACDKEFIIVKKNNPDQESEMTQKIKLKFENLANLGPHEQYEGWLIVDGAPVSTGTFTVDDKGKMSSKHKELDDETIDKATSFVLTVEPMPDNDPKPSMIKLLAGDFSGNKARLDVGHGMALTHDFEDAAGKYVLATPTTASMEDELSGIWFLDLMSGSPMEGLNLPMLPEGWIYEGWTVIDGKPVSTGRFMMANEADDMAPFSGPMQGPPFPGEDFVNMAPSGLSFPTNLSGETAVITIEPYPDNNPAPFQLKPLLGEIPANAKDHQTYMLKNQVNMTFPMGYATK